MDSRIAANQIQLLVGGRGNVFGFEFSKTDQYSLKKINRGASIFAT